MSDLSELPFALLPEELQCYIFELAADDDLEDAGRLTLVSRRVSAWLVLESTSPNLSSRYTSLSTLPQTNRVQPRLFREVVLWDDPALRGMTPKVLELKSKQFTATHVKRLCLPPILRKTSIETSSEILSACNGVVDLAFWLQLPSPKDEKDSGVDEIAEKIFSSLDTMFSLQRLSVSHEVLLRMDRALRWTGAPAWCGRLKYLDHNYATVQEPALLSFPCLKHLSFRSCISVDKCDEHDVNTISILRARPSLQVVLFAVWPEVADELGATAVDHRVVYLSFKAMSPLQNWRKQYESNGMWAKDEEYIAQRRKRALSSRD